MSPPPGPAAAAQAAPAGRPPRVLLIRLSAVGDCIHALPALAALRRHWPQAHLGWAIEETAHALLRGHPFVDQWHLFPRAAFKHKEGSFRDRWNKLSLFRKELREAHYDVAVDLQGLTKSGLVGWWSGAAQRIAFAGAESRELNRVFANERVRPPDGALHVIDRNLSLLAPLGIKPPLRPEWVLPDYGPEAQEMDAFLQESGLDPERPLAIVNPGATWPTKRWAPESFGEVARALAAEHGLAVVAPWAGDAERRDAETIVRLADSPQARVAPPTNLRQLAALIGRATLFVGNDTGPLHLAVALGVRSVAVFGATDPLRNGPYGGTHRILAGGPECQPCWKVACPRKDQACLASVPPARVAAACAQLLAQARRAVPC